MLVDGGDGGIQMSEQQMMMTPFIKRCLISPDHHQHSTWRISAPAEQWRFSFKAQFD